MHPAIPDLPGFLERLRSHRIPIGIDRAVLAEALLQRLEHEGIILTDPETAARWMAPVLSTNPREQRAVVRLLAARAGDDTGLVVASREGAAAKGSQAPVPRAATSLKREPWRFYVAATVVAGLMLSVLLEPGAKVGDGAPPTSPLPQLWIPGSDVLLGLACAFAVFVLAYGLTRIRVARLIPSATQLAHAAAAPDPDAVGFFGLGPLRSTMRALRAQFVPEGRRADIPLSIRRTVRSGGLPELFFGQLPRSPKYLVMVETRGRSDHVRLLPEILIHRLRVAQVQVEAFTFGDDPALLRRWDRPSSGSERLEQVLPRFPDYRLIVVSDGTPFWDPLSGALLPVTASLRDFAVRLLLTPAPATTWGLREAAFMRASFKVMELTSHGLGRIARWLESPQEAVPRGPDGFEARRDIAAELEARAATLMQDRPPSASTVADLVDLVHYWVGEHGFVLLCATAVYPQPGPGLTARLAAQLARHGPGYDEDTVNRVSRLPWLRRGRMPGWLRIELLKRLSPYHRAAVADAYLLFLSGEDANPLDLGGADRERLLRLALASLREVAVVRSDAMLESFLKSAVPWWRKWTVLAPLAAGIGAGVLCYLNAGPLISIADSVARTVSVFPLIGWIAAAQSIFCSLFSLAATAHTVRVRTNAGAAASAPPGRVAAKIQSTLSTLAGDVGTAPLRALGVASIATVLALLVPANLGMRIAPMVVQVALCALLVAITLLIAPRRFVRADVSALWPALRAPWGAVMTAALIGFAYSAFGWQGSWPHGEAQVALAAAVFAGVAATFAARVGAVDAHSAFRLAMVFVAGQALAGCALGFLAVLQPSGTPDKTAVLAAGLLSVDVRLLGGLLACMYFALGRVSSRAAGVLAGGLLVFLAIGAGAVLSPYGWIAAIAAVALPCRYVLASLAFGGRTFYLMTTAIVPKAAGALFFLSMYWTRDWNLPHPVLLAAFTVAIIPEWLFAARAVASIVGRIAPQPSRQRTWRLWLYASPLLLCDFSYTFGPPATWQITWLAIPMAAWLAARFGMRALPVVAVMLAPMVIDFSNGPLQLGRGLPGLFLAALLTVRLVADADFRRACFAVNALTARNLVVVFALLPWAYYTPNWSGFQVRTGLAPLLVLLFVLIGASRAPLRPVRRSLVMAVGFGFGFLLLTALGYIPRSTEFGMVGFVINNGADLVGGLLLLAGARRFAIADDAAGGSQPAQEPSSFGVGPALIAGLAGLAFFSSMVFYLAIAWSKQGIVQVTLFSFAHACLFSLAFGMASPKRWWIVALIAAVACGMGLVGSIRPSSLGLQVGIRSVDVLQVLCVAATAAGYARMGAVIVARGWRPWQDLQGPSNFSVLLGVVRQDAWRIVSAVVALTIFGLWAGIFIAWSMENI